MDNINLQNRHYFVFLVAINDYPDPITKLNGCVSDIGKLEAFLKENYGTTNSILAEKSTTQNGDLTIDTYGRLNICKLENDQATYNNIIKGFKEFLCQAQKDDVVWFHYSGHGSEQITADEFKSIEPSGKDQTLVCYYTNPDHGQLHLADKELAVLLHYVENQDVEGNSKESPHIVVSLDSCHSGSGTRDFENLDELKSRNVDSERLISRDGLGAKKYRPIETYIDQYYKKRHDKNPGEKLEVPLASHLLLSACASDETAGELPSGGIFSNGLLKTLAKTGTEITYADLFIRSRAVMKKIRNEQTPKLAPLGNFNPNTRFLEGTIMDFTHARDIDGAIIGTSGRYELVKEGDQWYIKCGAVYGIPVNPTSPIQLNILDKKLGKAEIISVGVQKSKIKLIDEMDLSKSETYFAILNHLTDSPEFVKLSGDPEIINNLKKKWNKSQNVIPATDEDEEAIAVFEVEVNETHILVLDLTLGRIIMSEKRESIDIKLIIANMDKMIKWRRMLRLNNEASQIRDWVNLETTVIYKDRKKATYQNKELVFHISEGNFLKKNNLLFAGFEPKVVVKNTSQKLYFYLFHFRLNYSIKSYEGEFYFKPGGDITIPLLKKIKGWGLTGDDEIESESYFKVWVTTEPMDYFHLEQDGIGYRDVESEDWTPMAVSEEWFTLTMKIKLLRQIATIDAKKEISLADELTISTEGELKAKIGFSSVARGVQSHNPTNKFPKLETTGFHLIDFSNRTEVSRKNILEFTELTDSSDSSLNIRITKPLKENQRIIPVMFDGNDFRIAGETHSNDDITTVKITHFPDLPYHYEDQQEMRDNPFQKGDRQHISLYSSLKIGFFLSENGIVPKAIKTQML